MRDRSRSIIHCGINLVLAVGCCLALIGLTPANADSYKIREWPGEATIPAIALEVRFHGPPDLIHSDTQQNIVIGCVAFLGEKLAVVAPEMEVLSPMEDIRQDYHATAAWAGYDVWLAPWRDATNREVILGVAILKISVRGTHHTSFVPALFQSAPDERSIATMAENVISKHMMSAIVIPIGRSLSQ